MRRIFAILYIRRFKSVQKKVLKEIAFQIMENDSLPLFETRFQVYHYILEIIDTKLLKPETPPMKRKAPKNVVTIKFVNKGLDDIHVSKIFSSQEVTSLLPEELQDDDDVPACTMKLDPPIRSKILNYRETVMSLTTVQVDDVSFVENLPSCDCTNSVFCDPHHGHIVSGDLRPTPNYVSFSRKVLTTENHPQSRPKSWSSESL